MSVYLVELKVECLVEADGSMQAMMVAESNARDIIRDGDIESDCIQQVKSIASLPNGYKKNDTAYTRSGAGKMLSELLPDEDPFVDTKTIDMFTGQPHRRQA